jgi:hypothetical protein
MAKKTLRSVARRVTPRRAALLLPAILAMVAIGFGSDASAASFGYQPITIQRINLPSSVGPARWPGFTTDGRHLLFFSSNELWITDLHGDVVHCLTCGVANDPKLSDSADLETSFPDGKRVLIEEDIQPGKSNLAVLECQPSVADCRSEQILPVDFSGAEPAVIPPGGALSTPQMTLGGAEYHAQLSPDGHYVGFSEIRTDAFELMVVGKLEGSASEYVVTDPRVINPPAPTSPFDTNVDDWSDSSALMEFKTFTHGGADATYVEVGGPSVMSTQTWSVNLASGQRTQLTNNPDWNEDNGVSPNGKLLSLFSDRTMHYIDSIGGIVPVRDFIDAPASAMAAGALGGFSECMGPMWLLPAAGDDGGRLAGEPIVDYQYPGVHVVDTLAESSQWSPNGTMIALNTTDDPTGQAAPFLLVAHLTSVKPSRPLRAVSSQPGAWAPSPTGYHGTIGYEGTVTLHGPRGGTVTVHYGATAGALAGSWSETYANYSENGKDEVSGTVAISGTALDGNYSEHLTMTGGNTGSDNTDLTFGTNGTSGHATSTYDGHTITGPSTYATGPEAQGGPKSACPGALPKRPALQVAVTIRGNGRYKLKVTARVSGVGPSETAIDTEPVDHAAIRLGRKLIYTDSKGIAIVNGRHGQKLTVAAGDTLVPATSQLPRQQR